MKRECGHVFMELYLMAAAFGVATALLVPRFMLMRGEIATHQCALVLDTGAPGARCPLTNDSIEPDPVTHERCCPNPKEHALEALCTKAGGPALASLHTPPSDFRRIAWTTVVIITGSISGFFVLFIIAVNIRARIASGLPRHSL